MQQSEWGELAELLDEWFPYQVANRGFRYHETGRVTLQEVTPRSARAVVRGTRPYRVAVDIDGVTGEPMLDCDCPAAARGPCKHMYATLLALEDTESDRGPDWERDLARLEPPPPRDPWAGVPGATALPMFALSRRGVNGDAQAIIRVLHRTPLKSGGWSVPKPIRGVEARFDAEGKRLQARVAACSRYGGYYAEQLCLVGPDVRATLLDLAHAGVLYGTGDFARPEPDDRIRPDGEGPYAFRLEIERGAVVRLTAHFVRGASRMPLDEPDLVLPCGLMLAGDTLYEIEFDGGWHWYAQLRRSGTIELPEDGYPALAQRLVEHGAPVALELPGADAPPVRPMIRFEGRSDFGYGFAPAFTPADVAFRYGDAVVSADSAAERVVDPSGAAAFPRDLERERAHLARLLELGAKPGHHGNAELPAKRALSIVAVLMREGWIVEGDGDEWRESGEWNIEVTTGIDWFELNGGLHFGDATVALPEILKAVRAGESFVRLGDGARGVLPDDVEKRLGLAFDLAKRSGEGLRFTKTQGWLLDALLEQLEGDVQADSGFADLRLRASEFSTIQAREAPRGFRGELRPYQRDALGWLRFLETMGLGGCLADDMGLGKTVMVLAHLRHRRQGERKPALVVAPKSLVWNWIDEARKFAPTLKVLDYAGPKSARDPSRIPEHDLVVTTYGVLRRDAPVLKDVPLSYAILDEAQAVKNPSSQAWKAARLLQADHRLALTGTPVENHLGDLWAILEILNPGMLGSRSTHSSWARANGDEAGLRKRVARLVKPVVLRRTKEAVLKDLPPRQETRLHCEMGPKQKRAYEELRDHYRAILLGRVDEEGMAAARMHVLEALLRLRQCACHPGLLDGERAAQPSAKFDTLLPMLDEVREAGRKALVFSQFTSLLALLKEKLDAAGLPYAYLDGQTRKREEVVRGFVEAPDVPLFLISLKAGGVGLNLTAADHVFLLDPWWNPAVERQAVDRTHRIGQERTVNVYRLVTKGTVEERILELQERKRELAEAVVGADSGLLRKLTRDDLEALLGGP